MPELPPVEAYLSQLKPLPIFAIFVQLVIWEPLIQDNRITFGNILVIIMLSIKY